MKQLLITLALILSTVGFFSEVSAQPSSDDSRSEPGRDIGDPDDSAPEQCTMAAGPGGLTVFPLTEKGKMIMQLGVKKFRSVFFGKVCGMKDAPKIVVPNGSDISCDYQKEGHRSGDVYTGWRVVCNTTDSADIGKSVVIKIEMEVAFFELTIFVVRSAHAVDLTTGKGLSAEQLRKYEQLVKDTKQALSNSRRALRIARRKSGKAELPMIGVTFGILFNPALDFRPGVDTDDFRDNPSGGFNLSVYWYFLKGGWNDSLQLGVLLDASWFRNKLEIDGLPPNPDLPSEQWDVMFNIAFRFRPWEWFSVGVFTGIGPSFVSHADTVVVQESAAPYRVAGVKDNANVHFTWAFGGGIQFHIKRFTIGLTLKYTYGSDEVITPSVVKLDGIHGNPEYFQTIAFMGFELN